MTTLKIDPLLTSLLPISFFPLSLTHIFVRYVCLYTYNHHLPLYRGSPDATLMFISPGALSLETVTSCSPFAFIIIGPRWSCLFYFLDMIAFVMAYDSFLANCVQREICRLLGKVLTYELKRFKVENAPVFNGMPAFRM